MFFPASIPDVKERGNKPRSYGTAYETDNLSC